MRTLCRVATRAHPGGATVGGQPRIARNDPPRARADDMTTAHEHISRTYALQNARQPIRLPLCTGRRRYRPAMQPDTSVATQGPPSAPHVEFEHQTPGVIWGCLILTQRQLLLREPPIVQIDPSGSALAPGCNCAVQARGARFWGFLCARNSHDCPKPASSW